MIARFLRKLLSIKPSEQQEIFYLFMTLLVFSVGASFARSIGMTLLVENLGGEKLPLMFIFIDLSVMMGSMLYARYTNKFSGLNILGFFLLSTALFSVIAQLLCTLTTYWWPQQNWVYGFFFVGFYFFYILISIHTGSVVASYFTAVEARRVTPIINAGIPIGGALGGGILIVLLNVFQFHPQQLILVLALACLGAFWLARIINAKPIRTGNNAQSVVQKNLLRDLIAAFKNIITSKLMIYMSLGLMLFVIGNKLLEYHYQTIIYYQVFPDPTRRATFFATYEVFANLAWLFVQLFLTSRLLVKWSVGASNVLYPVLSATAALALFIYFYGEMQGILPSSVIVMLGLGIFTQFINQEMRGALRTPANNLLFNAIDPHQWGNNKAFLHGIVFPLATLIAGTFLITITGAESLIAKINWSFSLEQQSYLLPVIALIVSILGIFIALPQWSQYEKDMQKRLEDEFVKKILGHQVNVKGGIKEIRRVIRQKLNSTNTYDVIAALDMIRILRSDLFLNQVGNLLINEKTQDFKVKKHCLKTLAALPRSNANLNYLLEALRTEQDARILPLIVKNLTKFKSVNFNHMIEKLLTHPAHEVFVEACLYLHRHPKYMRNDWIEKQIMARFDKAQLPLHYLYALGELRLSRYSDKVLPFLDNPELRLTALTALIRLHEPQLEAHKERLIKALDSPDNEMKIVALRALKNCRPLNYWAPVIQLLGARDRRLVKESQELLQLNMGVCKSALIEALSSDKISVQQRFEIMLLIYHRLSNKQQQDLQKGADETLRKFVQVNGLLKFYESLEHTSQADDLIKKILQEIAEYHLDHILIIITFAAKQDRKFFQKVSNGLKSSSHENKGNTSEVLSTTGVPLANRLRKFFDERFITLQSIRRIYFALYGKPIRIDKKHYETQLRALNNDMIEACLLFIEQEKTGVLK
jgi:ATP/ADP translocase